MNMKKTFIAATLIVAFLFATSFAAALTSDLTVSVRGVDNIANETIAVDAGDSLSIKAIFTANENASDVRVRAFISGFRSEISDSTERFDIINGGVYSKFLSLNIPSDIDLSEDSTLNIRVESKTNRVEESFNLRLQRRSYTLEVLSVEVDNKASAGEILPVNVVLKNRGRKKLDDIYVMARIAALGIEQKVYVGDLRTEDSGDSREDAVERKIFLKLPSNAKPGVYSLEVEAYNDETRIGTKKNVAIEEAGFEEVISGATTKTISAGETASYDVVIVNPEKKVGVYELVPDSVSGLDVNVAEQVITISGQESRTVKVTATGKSQGSFVFGVDVKKDGKNVKLVQFTTIVQGGATSNIAVLTVVLVIVFVVLLIILIVLLTRKPQLEEMKESYY